MPIDTPPHVFISAHADDREIADRIIAALRDRGVRVWVATEAVLSGTSWVQSVNSAIADAGAVLVLLSESSKASAVLASECTAAHQRGVTIVAVIVSPGVRPHDLPEELSIFPTVDLAGDFQDGMSHILRVLPETVQTGEAPATGEQPEPARMPAKGYVFLSYVRSDASFIDRLKGVLEKRGYAYWDYSVSERNYHGALYRELEERIENAVAFIAIVSDRWRETEWTAAEYLYARDAGVPVFVVQCEALSRPFPILINQQTRIDMSADFARGAEVLDHELERKGL